jgi:hypothetical protein
LQHAILHDDLIVDFHQRAPEPEITCGRRNSRPANFQISLCELCVSVVK